MILFQYVTFVWSYILCIYTHAAVGRPARQAYPKIISLERKQLVFKTFLNLDNGPQMSAT